MYLLLVSSVGHRAVSVIVALTDGLLLLKPYLDTMEEVSPVHRYRLCLCYLGIYFQHLPSFLGQKSPEIGSDHLYRGCFYVQQTAGTSDQVTKGSAPE